MPDTDDEEYPMEDELEYDSDHWEPDYEFSDMDKSKIKKT